MFHRIAIQPNAKLPIRREDDLHDDRGRFRQLITRQLRQVSGKPVARMHYTKGLYLAKVVQEARVELVGWPANILFGNVSDLEIRAAAARRLLRELESGRMYFRRLSDEEVEAIKEDGVTPGRCLPKPPRRERSDKHKHRRRMVKFARYPLTGPKTPAIVEESDIEQFDEVVADEDPVEWTDEERDGEQRNRVSFVE